MSRRTSERNSSARSGLKFPKVLPRKSTSIDFPAGYPGTGEYDMYEWNLGNTFNYSEMANLIAPIYQGGALRAQVEIRSAEQKQAVAEYARAGQKAFSEVETALGTESILREREAILAAAIRDNEEALKLARVQFQVGSADLRTVEQSQLALYAARTSRLRVQSEQLAQRANLYLALGGGV